MTHPSVYERVTEAILGELEQGVAPWVKPWSGGRSSELPYNATSQRRYSGVNVLLLWGESMTRGYRNPAWITFNQAKGLGGHVKKGEHGCAIVYASTYTKRVRDATNGEEKEDWIPFLKFYTVFNVEQTEGLPSHLYPVAEPKPLAEALPEVEGFLARVGGIGCGPWDRCGC